MLAWRTLAVDALPVQGSIAKVGLSLCESYVVELRSRVYDVSICQRTNSMWLHFSLLLSENVAKALLLFLDLRVPDQADLF